MFKVLRSRYVHKTKVARVFINDFLRCTRKGSSLSGIESLRVYLDTWVLLPILRDEVSETRKVTT